MEVSATRIAREKVHKHFGAAFASKATNSLCLSIATNQADGLEAQSRPATRFILEFASKPSLVSGKSASENVFLSENESPQAFEQTNSGAWRRDRIQAAKRQFESRVRHLADDLCRLTEGIEYCWLNSTACAATSPKDLAGIVADPMISILDVPRRIYFEVERESAFPEFVLQLSEKSGKGIFIAIIDSEISSLHPALLGRVHQKQNYTAESWGNPHWHGTAVAGILASDDVLGTATESILYNYKIISENQEISGNDFHGALAIQQAVEDGMQIANCSWGTGKIGDGTGREARACDGAWDLGMIIIKSSGNNKFLTSPAEARGVIVVGATDLAGTKVQDYSGRGKTKDGRSRPDLVAPGGNEEEGFVSCKLPEGFGTIGYGTSFAAPIVTGIAARILEAEPDLTPDEVRSRLLRLCRKLPGDDECQGAGLMSL